jgi:hypothetical protein
MRIKCPLRSCPNSFGESDDVAVHLMDRHGYAYDEAVLWLRTMIEADAHPAMRPCQCEECEYWNDEAQNGNYKGVP